MVGERPKAARSQGKNGIGSRRQHLIWGHQGLLSSHVTVLVYLRKVPECFVTRVAIRDQLVMLPRPCSNNLPSERRYALASDTG